MTTNLQPKKSLNSWPRAHSKKSQKTEKPIASAPRPTPFINQTQCPWYGIFPLATLGLLWLCSLPALEHLLTSWTWGPGKSPWFYSNKWKHQRYHILLIL